MHIIIICGDLFGVNVCTVNVTLLLVKMLIIVVACRMVPNAEYGPISIDDEIAVLAEDKDSLDRFEDLIGKTLREDVDNLSTIVNHFIETDKLPKNSRKTYLLRSIKLLHF